VLTGRHAYPAADFNSLPSMWGFAVARPSQLISDIPDALDSLILELLQLEPRNRPSSAADAMERLASAAYRVYEEAAIHMTPSQP
jgi:serine/threonine protein kinase